MFDPGVVGGEGPVDSGGHGIARRHPGDHLPFHHGLGGGAAVRDEQLVAVVTFLGDPTVAQAQYLDASP